MVLAAASNAAADVVQLHRSFADPPDDARITMAWMWFGPAVSKPEIERQMTAMKNAGIGGFRVFPLYPVVLDDEIPGTRNLRFLSPEFLDALRFTGTKARELGLQMELLPGSAWPYGGRMFTPAESAGRLRTQVVRVPAGRRSVNMPRLYESEALVCASVAPVRNDAVDVRTFQPVTLTELAPYIPIALPTEAREAAEVLFFIAGRASTERRKAAVGDEGPALDHYDPAAVNKFLREVVAPEVGAAGEIFAIHCDSLEVAGANWTRNLTEEFQRRRGYDLRPHLPELVRYAGEKTADLRHDWGQTLTELLNEHFIARLQDCAHAHGTKLRMQAYGWPPAGLHSYARVDIIEGEGSKEFSWKNFSSMRWASSASHLLGRSLASAETWTWLHTSQFRATPLDLKAHADLYFLQGANHLVGHMWPYSPREADYPGWRMYAAASLNDNNPWWVVMPDVTRYLQRVSHLLRQGNAVNDVALHLGNSDAWARFDTEAEHSGSLLHGVGNQLGPEIIPAIIESGFGLDFFDDSLLEHQGRVEGGTLAFAGMRYRAVVLAGVERIPLNTLRKLEKFAHAGGLVIATRRLPERVPGFLATAAAQTELKAIVQRLFVARGAPGVFVADDHESGKLLARRLTPDVVFGAPCPALGFAHRRTTTEEIYFLANTGNTPVALPVTFRVAGLYAEWWDPLTGQVESAEMATHSTGTTVDVSLDPHGSRFLVFTRRQLPVRTTRGVAAGTLDLSRDWSVFFDPDGPAVKMERLRSWTDAPATRNFSGTATYEKRIAVQTDLVRAGNRLELDFGEAHPRASPGMDPNEALNARGIFQQDPPYATMQPLEVLLDAPVREAAVVYVNGHRAGSVWHPPYRLDVTGLVRAGENHLRIVVANLAVNHMAGRPTPDRARLDAVYGERVRARETKPEPVTAGLLGPIKLVAITRP